MRATAGGERNHVRARKLDARPKWLVVSIFNKNGAKISLRKFMKPARYPRGEMISSLINGMCESDESCREARDLGSRIHTVSSSDEL
ncbi:hypothetical protein [Burkholderia stagnalis]|uniref:hypothetical protein n=1 Tax=Burkholderia stagnalis TaxID=1503054 RepID=UPI000A850845|nr:hypothetical protein [Burkholderia stagnalis]